MCRVNSCCCGCSLRTGTLVIGILDLLSSATLFIGSILLIFFLDVNSYENRAEGKARKRAKLTLTDALIIFALVTGVLLISDILLLIGVVKEKASLISPWLYNSYVNLFASSAAYILLAFLLIGIDDDFSAISLIITAVVSLGLRVYFIVVVRSHYSALITVTYDDDAVEETDYPVALPQTYPDGQQQFYPNVNVQQMGYTNEQQPYTSGQQQMYPNVQQTYRNSQSPYPSDLEYQYPTEQQQRFQTEQQRFPRVQPQRFQSEQQRFQSDQERYRSGPKYYETYPNSGNRFHPDADQEFPSFNAPNVRRFAQ